MYLEYRYVQNIDLITYIKVKTIRPVKNKLKFSILIIILCIFGCESSDGGSGSEGGNDGNINNDEDK